MRLLPLLVLAALTGCTVAPPPADPAPTPEPTPAAALDAFHDDAARAVCDAAFRCCDGAELTDWLAGATAQPALEEWAGVVPADADACTEQVAAMFAVAPFGDWVAHAQAGDVAFNADAFAACTDALEAASCGAELRAALFDETCLSWAAPYDGEQRSMFERTAVQGDACVPVRDGIGAGFVGTCDPAATFCCYDDPDCAAPFDVDGNPREGVCAPAAGEGEACSALPPIQLCTAGLSCDSFAGVCVAAATAPLAVGDACADDSWNLLGECQGSWCDLFGSHACEPLRPDGESCTAGYECTSGACDGVCVQNTFCSGT